MALEAGRVVGQRYRVEGEIATGGMGAVYRVTRLDDGAPLALKVIRKDRCSAQTAMDRFRREAQLLDKLEHPQVVRFFDAGRTDDGSLFLVMELLEGETLLHYLHREAPVAAPAVAELVRGIATALDAVHSVGVVHRDLKPGNVFLTPSGVKLVDFGIAKAANVTRLTITGQIVGTVRYMAPEQVMGNSVDSRADGYSLGVIAWSALAGGPPFTGKGMDAVREVIAGLPPLELSAPELGPEICAVVHKATAREADARFATAGAFAEAFEAAVTGAPLNPNRPRTGFVPLPATNAATPKARARAEPETRILDEGPTATVMSEAPPAVRAMRRRQRALVIGGVMLGFVTVGGVGVLSGAGGLTDDVDTTSGPPTSSSVEDVAESEAEGETGAETETEAEAAAEAEAPVLTVFSDPPGAMVEIDGAMVGNTPIDVPAPADRTYRVTARLAGFETLSTEIGPDYPQDEVHLELSEHARRRSSASPMQTRAMAVEEPPARHMEDLDPWAD